MTRLTPETRITEDLGASLDFNETILACEEHYGIEIPDEDAEQQATIGALAAYIEQCLLPPQREDQEEDLMIIIDDEVHDLLTPTGPMRTYVFRPAAEGRYPGLVLYSEIFQMTGPIRRMAAFLAGNGYVVAVPEIYHELEPAGTVLSYDTAGSERGNAHKTTKELSGYDSDARATLDFLTTHSHCTGKLGVMGVCIGGHLAFRAAMNPDVLAAACFYATDIHVRGLGRGMNDDTLDRMGDIPGEALMVWGRQDPHVPREGRQIIYNTMNDAGVLMQWHEFNAAHAFLRDVGPRFDPAMARLGYTLALELFGRRLGAGDLPAAAH